MNSWSNSLKVLLVSLIVAGTAAIADAPPPPSIFFWNSGGGTDYVKSPAKWGNGDFSVSRAVRFDTSDTLQVTTRNLSEGVRFDLKEPLDLTPYQDRGILRLRVQFDRGAGRGGFGGGGFGGGGRGGAGGRGRRGAAGGGNFGGAGNEGATGGGFAPAAPLMQPRTTSAAQILPAFGGAPGEVQGGIGFNPVPQGPPRETTEIDHLQVTFVLAKGIMAATIEIPKSSGSDTDVDMRRAHADDDGWMLFMVPLKSMRSTPDASGPLQRVILTSDNEDTYYVSELALVVATDNMAVSIRRQSDPIGTQEAQITVKPGRLTLVADVEAGDGDPQVTWNFDADNPAAAPPTVQGGMVGTAPAGMPGDAPQAPVAPQVDARGLVVTHTYPNQEQNYRVEVKVHDRTGKNPDVTASLLVRVRNGS